jgi:hypothetical protein
MTPSPTDEAPAAAETKAEVPAQVLGVTIERSAAATTGEAAPGAPAATSPAVLGVNSARSAVLARTGFGVWGLVLVAAGLLLAGFAMVRRSKGGRSAL